ncbi:uncharacterized protein J7T54_005310 [Emericellopsis cladophorae]|uniref:Pathway-specific nitrogen regulator n=1 Tax=Emericellopsis cladophorae TaxID=2686198 RepID=A0A9P9Y136_9HYPO|nr:uncharacterized protein J7T54_005310 [Emericellopsis cladophorae]KAI6781599.1 hypothetical protein J7T54_005310 [Emericellopsis cladophorae]
MARRNKRGRAAAAAANDFTIHEDQPTPIDDSDIRDFANGATESNLTKASTLVNEDASAENDEKSVEARLDSMLEELGDKKNTSASSSRRESLDSRRDSFDSLKRSRDSLHEANYTEDNVSRRESGASYDATDDSYSRRDSNGTDSSRGESRYSESQDQSALDDSVLGDHSTTSEHSSSSLHRRASGRTEALIHAAARNIVDQIHRSDDDESDFTESYVSNSRASSQNYSKVPYVPGARDMGVRPSDALCYVSNGPRRRSPPPPSDDEEDAMTASARVSDAHSLVREDLTGNAESVVDDAHEPFLELVSEVEGHEQEGDDFEDSWAALVEGPEEKAARQSAQEAKEAEAHIVESVPSPVVDVVEVPADEAAMETLDISAAANDDAPTCVEEEAVDTQLPKEVEETHVPKEAEEADVSKEVALEADTSVHEPIEESIPEPASISDESAVEEDVAAGRSAHQEGELPEPSAEVAQHEEPLSAAVEEPAAEPTSEETTESVQVASKEEESEPVAEPALEETTDAAQVASNEDEPEPAVEEPTAEPTSGHKLESVQVAPDEEKSVADADVGPEVIEEPAAEPTSEETTESIQVASHEEEPEAIVETAPEVVEEDTEKAAESTLASAEDSNALPAEEPTASTIDEDDDTVAASVDTTAEVAAPILDEQPEQAPVTEDAASTAPGIDQAPEAPATGNAEGERELDTASQPDPDHFEDHENSIMDRSASQCGDSVIQSIENDDEPVPEENADSSHNEHEDDVFSDHSPRSSVGSTSGEDHRQHREISENVTHRTRTHRMSDFSHYETDDQDEIFIPTVRGTPRPPFRSPSSVKAIQMSSPAQSVIGSSRSSRRTPIPSGSRLGSPSAQYSPKRTPPRFRRATPPLVLLHVTLLPLRWGWGDVLEQASSEQLSEGSKRLKQAWRQLQDRMGDTTCERGILLPHPQNDFEILEERLLEALELPLRRRARILECGHYLGPANETTILEESSEEEDDEGVFEDSHRQSRSSMEKKHWCNTCRSEIRFDALGADKVFRVKVYASNGLVKAGAWEACWKEMERVDVEIEPIVESDIQEEMARLDDEQQQALELHQEQLEEEEEEEEVEVQAEAEPECMPEQEHIEEEVHEYVEEPTEVHHEVPSSPVPEIRVTESPAPPSADEQQRQHDERLREIYGHSPEPVAHPIAVVEQPPPSPQPVAHPIAVVEQPRLSPEYTQRHDHQQQHHHHHHQTPPPPPVADEYARYRDRRQSASRDDSLPELILEATKVMLRDSKNVAILLMSVLVLVLALRGGSSAASFDNFPVMAKREMPAVVMPERPINQGPATVTVTAAATQSMLDSGTMATVTVTQTAAATQASVESLGHEEVKTVSTHEIVKVYETVTETAFETSTVTAPQASALEETTIVNFSDIRVEGVEAVPDVAGASVAPEGDLDQAPEPVVGEADPNIDREQEEEGEQEVEL